jgi:hypothetical protein
MLANVDQPATRQETDLIPSVSYDLDQKEIQVKLICLRTPDNMHFKIQAPMIAVPGRDVWTMIWTLVYDTGVTATFNEGWIIAPWPLGAHLPDGVVIQDYQQGSAEDQWQCRISYNSPSEDQKTAAFHYDIKARFEFKGRSYLVCDHDPTIVVVKDPIDGYR